MLSYQHAFHAGNHADVLKHWCLLETLLYLQKKDKPFDYIDTHAGDGLYSLKSQAALKTGEASAGVLKLIDNQPEVLKNYLDVVLSYIAQHKYPGSPKLVQQHLRSGDHAWFFEMHPQAITNLQKKLASKTGCFVKTEDGFKGLLSLLPNKNKRALVLMDPSYEIKADYRTVVETVEKAYKKMPQTVFLLWYPVVDREQITQFEKHIKKTVLKNVHLFEMGVADDANKGMTASGMIVVNPPWTLPEQFKSGFGEVSQRLSEDGIARTRYELLIAE
ncbi:23S rRNA (adenine(2030)-N(6))-methyltransferase RlmJ [Sessilibacter sp. MAH4]